MTSYSNNIMENCLNEKTGSSAPVSTNMIIDSPSASPYNGVSSNVSLDGFQQVENKKKTRIKRKLTTSTFKKKRTHHQMNVVSKNVPSPLISSMSSTVVVEPHINKSAPTTENTLQVHNAQLTQNVHVIQNTQQALRSSPVQNVLTLSGPQQISVTTESTRYAQTRFPFPPFIIRFNAGKVTSGQIKEGLTFHCKQNYQMEINILNCRLSNRSSNNEYDFLLFLKDAISFSLLLDAKNWPDTFGNMNYMFPSSPSIPPQLSLIIKNVDLRLNFVEFSHEIKTNYPQVKNVIRLKNKFNNDIKLVKLELTSATVRDELLSKRKINVGYIVYDIDEYLAPANILICSKCMGLGHFMKQCRQIKSTCRTCGESVDDLKLHNCSNVEKCIHCGQNHRSNSLKCQVVKSFRSELTRKLLSSNNHSSTSSTNMVNNTNHSNFQYFNTDFPPMPLPQHPPSNINNSMLTKLDDLLRKITEINNHLSNLELKYNKFEQFMIEKNASDSSVKEDLNLLSKQYRFQKRFGPA